MRNSEERCTIGTIVQMHSPMSTCN